MHRSICGCARAAESFHASKVLHLPTPSSLLKAVSADEGEVEANKHADLTHLVVCFPTCMRSKSFSYRRSKQTCSCAPTIRSFCLSHWLHTSFHEWGAERLPRRAASHKQNQSRVRELCQRVAAVSDKCNLEKDLGDAFVFVAQTTLAWRSPKQLTWSD